MAPFIERLDRDSSTSVEGSEDARSGKRRSPVGMIWRPVMSSTPLVRSGAAENQGEAETLAACYRNSLTVARDNECQSVAFPGISTGIFGYPVDQACRVAVFTCAEFLTHNATPNTVTLCTFDAEATRHMQEALKLAA